MGLKKQQPPTFDTFESIQSLKRKHLEFWAKPLTYKRLTTLSVNSIIRFI